MALSAHGESQLARRSVIIRPAKKVHNLFLPIALGVGLLGAVTSRYTGDATGLDVACLAIFAVVISNVWQNKQLRAFLILVALWAVAIMLSNAVHGIGFQKTLSALTLPAVLGVSTSFLAWLAKGDVRKLQGVIAGVAIAHIVYVVIHGTTFYDLNPWKFGLALPVILLGLTIATLEIKGIHSLAVIVLAAAGVYSAINDFRSMAAICATAIVIALVVKRPPKPGRRHAMLKLFVGLIALVYAGYALYSMIASAGLLSYEAAAKYEAQIAQGNLLVAARPEIVGSWFAIQSSPLIGLGSGGKLDGDSTSAALNVLTNAGAMLGAQDQVRLFGDGVNSHSFLFSAWVGAGIVAAIPWAYMIRLGLLAIIRRHPCQRLLPLTVFWALAGGWDVLFSPNQPHYHVLFAGFVVLMTWQPSEPPAVEAAPVSRPLLRLRG
ncbi:hypothetical protein PP640_gp35 [Arthrobacter phage Faja]|uniref:Uncharacterized protein n=1 Tax=Arthrobacter phage Faja TaxID=2419957 RepID=A0A3G2KG04_9CAUD|nr:hypothetical protein PP640_gp35 [Arthrobacter phage Faja]AYN57888.1 hypothetical protein PBI_FAJA_35 [Arthrobacter phage Faja]